MHFRYHIDFSYSTESQSNLITSLLWVKITTRKENRPVVYTVEYSYGEIILMIHHEISFINHSNDCNKKKLGNDFFHLRHKIVIIKKLNTSTIHSNHMPMYQCWLKCAIGLIHPIYITTTPVYLDPSMGGTCTFCNVIDLMWMSATLPWVKITTRKDKWNICLYWWTF